jgi:hypothetical protein
MVVVRDRDQFRDSETVIATPRHRPCEGGSSDFD